MPIVSDLLVSIAGKPLDLKLLPLLCQVEVEVGVYQQGMMHMQLAVGQDANGDWARKIATDMTPGADFAVDVRIGSSTRRIIHGLLTLSRLNFSADVHDSRFEITGMDVLEKLKRKSFGGERKGNLMTVVRQVLGEVSQLPLASPTPSTPDDQISENQTGTNLDFLTSLGAHHNCELYVESTSSGDQAFFQKLDFAKPVANDPGLSATDLRINQGLSTNVRNAQFHIDLGGPTRVEANTIDKNGKAPAQAVVSDLRTIPTLSDLEKSMLGPADSAMIARLTSVRHAPPSVQTQCDSELEKHSWVVIGTGELDTAAYGAILYPRTTIQVRGAGSLFQGSFMVWKVTHTFSRDSHCQKFELRRRLGMVTNAKS